MNEMMTQQARSYTISCATSDLKEAFKFLKRAVPKNSIRKLYSCEMTIKTNVVFFVAIGVTRVLYCNASGPTKVTMPFLYLYDIIKRIRTFNTEIAIGDGEISIGKVTVSARTFFFQDDTILRSINLPINYSVDDILRLPGQYTPEELEFNKMNDLIKRTNNDMAKEIRQVTDILRKYGFTHTEIENLVHEKIFNKQLNSSYEK
jgi:hypothetical protein